MLTKVQLYRATSYQPGSRVIRALSYAEKIKSAKSENEKKSLFSTSEKDRK